LRLITKPGLYWLAFVLLGMSNTGCASLSYYQQAFVGQWSLLSNRRSLEDVLQDASVPANVRQRLELAQEIRVFAEVEIGLPVEQTFSSYVDTGKPYVVWNVFSAPEFSLTMESFCYPIAGCVNYKGFF
jgi:predicted aminopeptidase